MSWATVANKITFFDSAHPWLFPNSSVAVSAFSASEQRLTLGWLEDLYQKSGTAREVLDAAASQGPIRIGKTLRNNPGFQVDGSSTTPKYVGFNLEAINDLYYFNDHGQIVREVPALTIIHELIHYSLNLDDTNDDYSLMNGSNYDFDGDTLRKQNQIAREVGIVGNIQTSYSAGFFNYPEADSRFSLLQTGKSYSLDEIVNIVRLGSDSPLLPDLLDMSNRQDRSRDLLFGFGGNDVLRGGGGRDFLYGGDHDDTLDGGLDNDFIDGEGGIDTVDYSLGTNAPGVAITIRPTQSLPDDPRPRFEIASGNDIDVVVGVEKVRLTDQSDKVGLKGDIGRLQGLALTIDMRGSAVAFNQDIVDGSDTDREVAP